MSYNYNKKLVPIAQKLRKNMTPEEKKVHYDILYRLPFPVKRQANIGNYIVDFFIPNKGVVIEIDGVQHKLPEHKKSDEARDNDLRKLGLTVYRYTNYEINTNFSGVFKDILKKLNVNFEELKPTKSQSKSVALNNRQTK
ncbi:MAG: DUF559 domain-containing protein [Ruminococcaceae bacterium]|nr:DUF559 domain-containing protein [Oscillospiraceae bacterium]